MDVNNAEVKPPTNITQTTTPNTKEMRSVIWSQLHDAGTLMQQGPSDCGSD